MSNKIVYGLIVVGFAISVYSNYADVSTEKRQMILIFGIMLLLFGLYKIASKIPSKEKDDSIDEG